MQQIDKLISENLVVIDIDTGTVLGTNLKIVYVSSGMMEYVCNSDAEAIAYANMHGKPLFSEVGE